MIKIVPSWVYWFAIAALAVLLGFQHLAHKATVATMRAEYAQTLKGISDLATKAAELSVKSMLAWNAALAKVDLDRTKEKDDAKSEIEKLRADVTGGTRRLYIRATCPASSGSVPSASTPGSVVPQAAPQLEPDAQSAYFQLASEIADMTAQVKYLQDYVRTVSAP